MPALLKPTNAQESVWKDLFTKIMKIILQGKEWIRWTITMLCAIFPVPKIMKIPEAKAAVEKGWEKLEKIPAWQLTKVRNKKKGDRWSKAWGQNRTFCTVNGHLSSQEFGVGATVSEIQRSSCTLRWHYEKWFRMLRSIQWTRVICVTDDSCKSKGCHIKTTRMRRTSSGRNSSLHPGQNGRFSIIVKKNSEVRMSRYLDTSTKTSSGQNHGPVWKIRLFLLSETCTVIL